MQTLAISSSTHQPTCSLYRPTLKPSHHAPHLPRCLPDGTPAYDWICDWRLDWQETSLRSECHPAALVSAKRYTEKATKAWHRKGGQKHNKTKNSYNQPDLASAGTTHRSNTGLHRKIKPQVQPQNTHHHSNPGGKLPAGGMVGADAVGTVGGGGESGRAGAAHETGAVENAALRGAPGDAGCYRWCTKANCM